nr:MAG TPA: hypothetical protein [Caudoviricetes sp.]
MHRALKSFSGAISMHEGETREIDNAELVADLLQAGYIEEVKPKRGRNAKKSGDANPQE